jgi:hypothetical protein
VLVLDTEQALSAYQYLISSGRYEQASSRGVSRMLHSEGLRWCSNGLDVLCSACQAAIMYSYIPLAHHMLDPIVHTRCQYLASVLFLLYRLFHMLLLFRVP